ncbi:MAG: Mur ligase domain-containing protein, partial [Methylococcales bacterium]|nr:Mur ligase domain-containing protein [Methylococcales bacterium]
MRIHIIGVGTTFMSGLAILARQAGHEVSGSDNCILPKVRWQLESAGVRIKVPFSIKNLDDKPELVIIGNELYPDNEELYEARQRNMPYISGALWLEEYVLHDKWSMGTTLKDIQNGTRQKDDFAKPIKR